MIDVLFQFPNPFLTPTPDPATLAGGGGGIGGGTLIAFAGGAALALIPVIKSWVDNKGSMAVQTTQVALNSHTAMLTSALQRADRLEAQLGELQKLFTELKAEFATVKTQLADKTAELASVAKERDDLRHRNIVLETENDELRATITRMELTARATGFQTINEKDKTK